MYHLHVSDEGYRLATLLELRRGEEEARRVALGEATRAVVATREAEARAAAAEAVACAEELDRAGVRWTPSQLETIRTLRDRAAGGP